MHRQRTELFAERVEVVGPYFVFGRSAVERNIGGAAIASVMQQNAIARCCDSFRQVDQFVVRSGGFRA